MTVFRAIRGFVAAVVVMSVVVGGVCLQPRTGFAKGRGAVLLKAESLFRLAKIKMKKRQFAESEKLLRRLVALNFPKDDHKAERMLAASHVGLVDVLVSQRKWNAGLKAANEALALPIFNTKDSKRGLLKAELYKFLARIYEVKGDMDKSEEYLEKALELQSQ